jgi:glycine cleavage system aminomethyltransferase T
MSDLAAIQLKRTGLYDFHLENGARMVPFAGYSMPLLYGDVGQGEDRCSCFVVFSDLFTR